MLLGGDELGRTQDGNNNAYCQDNEISWYDWELSPEDESFLAFVRRVIELRRDHPVFRRERFLTGAEQHASGLPDVWWFRPDGLRMTPRNWQRGDARTLGVFLNGEEITESTPDGARVVDDSFVVLFNASHEDVVFKLPPRRYGARWQLVLSTEHEEPLAEGDGPVYAARGEVPVKARTVALLTRR
jgi:glycogen operon protein